MAGSTGEKILAGEMIAALVTEWVATVWGKGHQGGAPSVPAPHQMLGVVFLYSGLALVAMFGPQPARLAGGVGALALLVILMKGVGGLFAAAGVKPKPVAGVAGNPNPEGLILA